MGKTIRITGTVKQGAIACGGDVIVAGTVEGDVASIGGSVVQLAGAKIGGDVIVLGGTYNHVDAVPQRNASSMTIMYAGYQEEIRNIMRSPTGLLRPTWSPGYLGIRLLAIAFWFIVALVLTAAMPGTISRGSARLQLTSLRVALIGGTVRSSYLQAFWRVFEFYRKRSAHCWCHVVDVDARGLALWTCCVGGGNWKMASAEIHSTGKAL
jgi:hypothetical protein